MPLKKGKSLFDRAKKVGIDVHIGNGNRAQRRDAAKKILKEERKKVK